MSLITEVDILDESKECFLIYSEEVLTDRAIPSAEDGLLSSQRKILWTMEEHLKMNSKGKTKKCQGLVGQTLATSYFHGDQSCYGVLCKMAQEYLMRYPLLIGQGALGTQESNDMVASSRYTEAKPSIFADLMFNDFKKNVVPLKETYNGEYMEPVILPSLFPNALVNGRQAIGISMAHNSAPMNLTEVCDGIIAFIEKNGNITVKELMEYIKGPDFPLGNVIINAKDIYSAFNTGRSATSLKIRGDYEIDEKKNILTFTSIPYRTYRNKIREQITNNIDELEKYIDDFSDESNLGKNKLIFYIKKGINPEAVAQKLFALTDLQTALSYNMNFIVNGTPKLCSLYDLIQEYVRHQTNVILNATQFDKEKAEKRIHILNGLLLAIDKIDAVISLIRNADDKADARDKLIKLLTIDEIQANAILDMKLSQLTKLDKEDLLIELTEKKDIVTECLKIINDEQYRNTILINRVGAMKEEYGDARRTQLLDIAEPPKDKKAKEKPVIIEEDCIVTVFDNGNVKRAPVPKAARRNTVGTKIKDGIVYSCKSTTLNNLFVFSSKGKMYKILINDISDTDRGTNLTTLAKMDTDEYALTYATEDAEKKYIFFITKAGTAKKVPVEEFLNMKKSGIIATKFNDGDTLATVVATNDVPISIITKNGMCSTFDLATMSSSSRTAKGMKGINLSAGDEVVTAVPHEEAGHLAVVSADGCGKRIEETLAVQGRGTKGVMVSKTPVGGAAWVKDNESIMVVGNHSSVCVAAKDIPVLARTAIGVKIIKNNNNVKLVVRV